MTADFFTFRFSDILLTLKPRQRWAAVRNGGDYGSNEWLMWLGLCVLILLAIAILVNVWNKRKRSAKSGNKIFFDYAKMRGLDDSQQRLLLEIVVHSGLKRSESIFTLPAAFERGLSHLTQQVYAQADAASARRLQEKFSVLRYKLGFGQASSAVAVNVSEQNDYSTTQIERGSVLYLKPYDRPKQQEIEAKVIASGDKGLSVKLSQLVEIDFGRPWRGRYYFRDVVWEFDSAFISCSGDVLVLSHSSAIRLINRRRFLRVPVQKPAYVASFPFARRFFKNFGIRSKKSQPAAKSPQPAEDILQPPQFVRAVVTELGGPGLVIDADLDVKVGEQVLLVFKLDTGLSSRPSTVRSNPEQVIEGLAVVRHIKRAAGRSYKIAVEFTNLDDGDISELIRATNEASISLGDSSGVKTAAVSEISLDRVPEEVEI